MSFERGLWNDMLEDDDTLEDPLLPFRANGEITTTDPLLPLCADGEIMTLEDAPRKRRHWDDLLAEPDEDRPLSCSPGEVC